jgi:transcriptional regulator with XRE-family HTH domain
MAFRVDNRRLADALRARFSTRGWTQSQVARDLGVAQSQISKILSGRFRFGEGLPSKVCKYAQIDLNDFLLKSAGDSGETLEAVRRFCRGDRRRERVLIRLLTALNDL